MLLGAKRRGKTSIRAPHQPTAGDRWQHALRFEGQDIIDMAAPAIASLGIAHARRAAPLAT